MRKKYWDHENLQSNVLSFLLQMEYGKYGKPMRKSGKNGIQYKCSFGGWMNVNRIDFQQTSTIPLHSHLHLTPGLKPRHYNIAARGIQVNPAIHYLLHSYIQKLTEEQ